MASKSKNESKTDFDLLTHINQNRAYSAEWEHKRTKNTAIQSILKKSSKHGTGKIGMPDLIYANEKKKLLILIENKASISNHISENGNKPVSYAVDGIRHYLSFFQSNNLSSADENTQRYLKNWKIVGIAFSGDINDQYAHILDTFIIKDETINDTNETSILDEDEYIAYFENIDLEQIASNISKSSKKINNLLRNVDSQKRPILLSALMICLYDKNHYFYNSYQDYEPKEIIHNMPLAISNVLEAGGVDKDKIEILKKELSFLETDIDLNAKSENTEILKKILKELEEQVIPLFDKKTAYDIIGKFYEEFLRYAGIANVKKGIVLTPNHITTLFSELIELKTDDIIFDPACGTGAFLIAGMKKLIDIINDSKIPNKEKKIDNIQNAQLLGIEKSTTMFTLAISNMLFRGDGKSQIYNEDFFSKKADDILKKIKPDIGFVNPPFGGKDNTENPTKREIQFLEKLLKICKRYVIMIAPQSAYFKDDIIKTNILKEHRLKYVINMPNDLFNPNAMTNTAIAVFETNIPHNKEKVIFYDLKEDGLVLSKNKGRTDPKNKWNGIKKELLKKIKNPSKYEDDINLVYKSITGKDEWIIQAHSKTDYSNLTQEDFLKSIRKYVVFQIKEKLNLLTTDIDELTMHEIFYRNNIQASTHKKNEKIFDNKKWKDFFIYPDLFEVESGNGGNIYDLNIGGQFPYISSTSFNNGLIYFVHADDRELHSKNTITLNRTGSVGEAFYQKNDYVASKDRVRVLIPKFKMNKYIAMFLIGIIKLEKYRYNYGRTWGTNRIKNTQIKLPVDSNGNPDWQFMENYIKSLPYSEHL